MLLLLAGVAAELLLALELWRELRWLRARMVLPKANQHMGMVIWLQRENQLTSFLGVVKTSVTEFSISEIIIFFCQNFQLPKARQQENNLLVCKEYKTWYCQI